MQAGVFADVLDSGMQDALSEKTAGSSPAAGRERFKTECPWRGQRQSFEKVPRWQFTVADGDDRVKENYMAGNQQQQSHKNQDQKNQQQQQETSDKGKRSQPGAESGEEPLTPSGNQHIATEE